MLGRSSNCSSGKHDSDDEAVKGQGLGEDHHEDEGDEDISLGVSTNTGITDDTDAKASSKRGETAAKSGTELLVRRVIVVAPGIWEVD